MVYVYRDHERIQASSAERILDGLNAFRRNDFLIVKHVNKDRGVDPFGIWSRYITYAWINYKVPNGWMIAETWITTVINAAQMKPKVFLPGFQQRCMDEAASRWYKTSLAST